MGLGRNLHCHYSVINSGSGLMLGIGELLNMQ